MTLQLDDPGVLGPEPPLIPVCDHVRSGRVALRRRRLGSASMVAASVAAVVAMTVLAVSDAPVSAGPETGFADTGETTRAVDPDLPPSVEKRSGSGAPWTYEVRTCTGTGAEKVCSVIDRGETVDPADVSPPVSLTADGVVGAPEGVAVLRRVTLTTSPLRVAVEYGVQGATWWTRLAEPGAECSGTTGVSVASGAEGLTWEEYTAASLSLAECGAE